MEVFYGQKGAVKGSFCPKVDCLRQSNLLMGDKKGLSNGLPH